MTPNLQDLEALARGSGEILRTGFGGRFDVDRKGDIDLVTEVDRRSEAFLLDEIGHRFPGHSLVAEESGFRPGDANLRWYIDPLDGTINYTHGVPFFSVSIAFARGGDLTLGVVYDPLRDECFTAERGRGAWLNGARMRVSTVSELDQSLLVTGFPHDVRTHPQNNLDHYAYFSLHTQGVRRLGSAALDLCYVAAGRFDGYWELRIDDWDIAAGALIVQEAGGVVTNVNGGSDFLSPPASILAGNASLHPRLLAGLNRS